MGMEFPSPNVNLDTQATANESDPSGDARPPTHPFRLDVSDVNVEHLLTRLRTLALASGGAALIAGLAYSSLSPNDQNLRGEFPAVIVIPVLTASFGLLNLALAILFDWLGLKIQAYAITCGFEMAALGRNHFSPPVVHSAEHAWNRINQNVTHFEHRLTHRLQRLTAAAMLMILLALLWNGVWLFAFGGASFHYGVDNILIREGGMWVNILAMVIAYGLARRQYRLLAKYPPVSGQRLADITTATTQLNADALFNLMHELQRFRNRRKDGLSD